MLCNKAVSNEEAVSQGTVRSTISEGDTGQIYHWPSICASGSGLSPILPLPRHLNTDCSGGGGGGGKRTHRDRY